MTNEERRAVYQSSFHKLREVLNHLNGAEPDSDEISEVLTRCLLNLDRLQDVNEAILIAWCRGALWRVVSERRRKLIKQHTSIGSQISHIDGEGFAQVDILPSKEAEPIDNLICGENIQILREELSRLTELERRAIYEMKGKDRSTADIAAELCKTKSAVSMAIHRARTKLLERLQSRIAREDP